MLRIRGDIQRPPPAPGRARVITGNQRGRDGLMEADAALYAYLREIAAAGRALPSRRMLGLRWGRCGNWAAAALGRLAERDLIRLLDGIVVEIVATGERTAERPLLPTPLQDRILAILAEAAAADRRAPSQRAIAEALGIGTATVCTTIQRMVDRGLLAVTADARSHRYRIAIAEQGLMMQARPLPSIDGTEQELDFLRIENARLAQRVAELEGQND